MNEIEMLANAIDTEADVVEPAGPDFDGLISSLQEIVYGLTEAVGMMKAEKASEPVEDVEPVCEPVEEEVVDDD